MDRCGLIEGVVECLELGRCQVIEGGGSTVGVVVRFDVSGELGAGIVPVAEATALEQLRLEGADE